MNQTASVDSNLLLKDLSKEELQDIMSGWGEKRFHGKQLFSALHRRAVRTTAEMTDLPLRLRERIKIWEPFDLALPVRSQTAPDGTQKLLLKLRDGLLIECVRIPEEIHATICLSTQVGCPLECTFCATGVMGFKRNLSCGEITEQVNVFQRQEQEPRIRNLVFMGMGEPLLNYENLIRAISTLTAPGGIELSQRRMTVSTAGIIPGIKQLSQEGFNVKLAISLNAPTDELRDKLMPINRKYPLGGLMKAATEFQQKRGGRITFEYALMPGINDTPTMIEALRKWLIQMPCKLNLIPLNPIGKKNPPQGDWDAILERFYRVLGKDKITLTMRRSRGVEIRAACGQLVGSIG